MQKAVESIGKSKIFIEDKTSINIRDIRTRANILKKKHNIGYIVVDYLQLMTGLNLTAQSLHQNKNMIWFLHAPLITRLKII